MGEDPRSDSVEILMSVSAWRWHGMPMLTIGGTGQAPGTEGRHRGGGAVTACVAVAAVALAVLHVDGVGVVDPTVQTISDYVAVPGGYALLGVAALALAAATVLLAGRLRPAGLVDPAPPAGWLVAAGVGLAGTAVFPTNIPGTDVDLVANLHRVGGTIALVALPVAAWMIARRAARSTALRPSTPALTWVSGAMAGLSAVFLLSHVPIVITGSPILTAEGVLQRVLYAVVMVVLLMIARATRSSIDAVRVEADQAPGTAEVRGIA